MRLSKFLFNIFTISCVLATVGCGKDEVVELQDISTFETNITEFAVISETEYFDNTTTSTFVYEDVASAGSSDVTVHNAYNLTYDNSVASTGSESNTITVDEPVTMTRSISASNETPDYSSTRSLEECFYGYTESELNSLTCAMLCNDRLGYSRNSAYSQSSMRQFVPFRSGSQELSFFYECFQNKTLGDIAVVAGNWNSLSEKQKLALGGFVYSGLIPTDAFVNWGINRDDIYGYATRVANY